MDKKANTAIICLSPYYGGMEMDAIRYARLLNGSVNVLLIAKQNSPIDENFANVAEIENINFESVSFRSHFSLSIINKIRKCIDHYQIRNVIYFGASELRSLFFAFLGKDINLLIRHGTTKTHKKKDPLHRLVYSQVNWHIPLCKHIADNVRQIIPFGDKTRMKIVYPSLRHPPVNLPVSAIRTGNPFILLHVARITENKGHIAAIRACHKLYEMGIPFKFICVGEIDPEFSSKLEDTLSDLPYRDCIEFPGFSDQLEAYYNSADIFIFPSRGEGLSSSFIEALSYGLVCISYNNTSFPELQELGFEFMMADNNNQEDLENKVMDAIAFLEKHKLPILTNVEQANRVFNKQRELQDILELLN